MQDPDASPLGRPSRMALAALLCAGLLVVGETRARGQESGLSAVPLDRWLVTWPGPTTELEPAVDPLSASSGQPIFPDRDVVAGPGYWSLARRAPPSIGASGTWIDLAADLVDPPVAQAAGYGEGRVIAHTYLRSAADRSVVLSISHPSCRRATAWLNGQRIGEVASQDTPAPEERGDQDIQAEVRLGAGWNTLLLALSEGACPGRIGGWIEPSVLPLGKDEREVDSRRIRVRASRPPGVRRSPPAGFVEVSSLGLSEGLVWDAGAEDLTGILVVPLTAWGAAADFRSGFRGSPAEADDPQGALIRQRLLPPPEVRPPAPQRAKLRIEVGGERRDTTVNDLETAKATKVRVRIPFADLREASLSRSQVELRLEWSGKRRELQKELPAGLLLTRLHGPISLRGWDEVDSAANELAPDRRTLVGRWRIPAALSGFTLEMRTGGAQTEYRLRGEALSTERTVLCGPCREGDRLELEVRVPQDWNGTPTVVIAEPGYPAAADDAAAPPATRWLTVLRGGGNRGYLELNARFSEPES